MTNESYSTSEEKASLAPGTAIDRATIVRRKRMAVMGGCHDAFKRGRCWKRAVALYPGDDGVTE